MQPDFALLQSLLTAYEITGELGRGAFGVVYAGRHTGLGRDVAIKSLHGHLVADGGLRQRFVAEAQLVAALEHPHVVPVYDFVEQAGMAVLIMERCTGTIEEIHLRTGLSTPAAVSAALATCAALDHAHRHRVLHRDIKPANLLTDRNGIIKLGDFGIARLLDAATRMTVSGGVVGTPAYMAPEQAAGEDIDARSDLYSTAVVLYELLSGELPDGEVASLGALVKLQVAGPARPLAEVAPDVPAPLCQVVDKALSRDRDQRYEHANALGVALAEAGVRAFGTGWVRASGFPLMGAPDLSAAAERAIVAPETLAGSPDPWFSDQAPSRSSRPTPPEQPSDPGHGVDQTGRPVTENARYQPPSAPPPPPTSGAVFTTSGAELVGSPNGSRSGLILGIVGAALVFVLLGGIVAWRVLGAADDPDPGSTAAATSTATSATETSGTDATGTGEFAAAQDCTALTEMAAPRYEALLQDVVTEFEGLDPTELATFDTTTSPALKRFESGNTDLDERSRQLGCGAAEASAAICSASATVQATNDNGRLMLEELTKNC